MKNLFTQAIIAFAVLFTFNACKKESTNPEPTGTKSKLTGTVQLWDDKVDFNLDKSGVTVSIDGVPSTTTDANGRYSFDNLINDIYTITFTKAGYGTCKLVGINHAYNAAGTTVPNKSLGKISTTKVDAFSYNNNTFNGAPGASFTYTLNPAPSVNNKGFVRYFLSKSASVSNTNYEAFTEVKSYSSNNIAGFSVDDLAALGFQSGQTVYIKMYGDSFISNDYDDPNSGKRIFPNLNTSSPAAVSFVIP
jgi:hypothetical protein